MPVCAGGYSHCDIEIDHFGEILRVFERELLTIEITDRRMRFHDDPRFVAIVRGGLGLINAGVYLLRRQIVRDLPAGRAISLESEVFPRLLDRRVYGLISTGLFIDIGIPDDFKRAQTLLASRVGTASYDSSALVSPEALGDIT